MLLPPMVDYHETARTHRRPAPPESFCFADIVDGYMYRRPRGYNRIGIADSIPVPALPTVYPYPHCRW